MSQDAPSWTPLPPRNLHPSLSTFIVQHQPVLPASASSSAGPRSGRTGGRRRYPQEAYDILSDYYTNVNKYPTKQELQNLVAQITVIPGCEDYNTDKAYAYFAGKRQQNGDTRAKIKKQGRAQQQPNQPQPPTSAEILYPTLVNEMSVLAKLDVLLTETPHPTDDVVKIWATRIGNGVWPEDIKTYAALKRARRPSEDVSH
ncbi:hypothetical protein C8Q70DRAFT_935249 [Cubamyces menziesii]|nr:hypothetical protein C8Q70DRAFT_935249 [Cubamyces menziesii]